MKGARDRTHGESTNGLYRRLLKSEIREKKTGAFGSAGGFVRLQLFRYRAHEYIRLHDRKRRVG